MKIILNLTLCVFISLILASCAPITTVRQDGSEVKHFFGYVRVIEPVTIGKDEPFMVSETESLGLRISKGIGVGYYHERSDFIPLDCRLVIKVTDKEQLERVFEIFSKSKIMEEGLCVTVSK